MIDFPLMRLIGFKEASGVHLDNDVIDLRLGLGPIRHCQAGRVRAPISHDDRFLV